MLSDENSREAIPTLAEHIAATLNTTQITKYTSFCENVTVDPFIKLEIIEDYIGKY